MKPENVNTLVRGFNENNSELAMIINSQVSILNEMIEDDMYASQYYNNPLMAKRIAEETINNYKLEIDDEIVKDIFEEIIKLFLSITKKKRNKELLVRNSSKYGFRTIKQMFGLASDESVIIAGPCAIENKVYLEQTAKLLKKLGVKFLRGGAYKPRTSPYDFQGLGADGLKILKEISEKYNLLTVAEVLDPRDVFLVSQYADVLQVGARNMQNFQLLKEIGNMDKPVLLKRGMSATIEEFILAAEYIALEGNRSIILCERGIRTYETKTRNTLDIACIPILKSETSLPVIADLSHSLGRKDIINPVAKAVLAAGADGIMVEVHPDPFMALSDSQQQLTFKEFYKLIEQLK